MLKFAAAGDSDFDNDDDYIDFEDESGLSSFHADVTDVDVSSVHKKPCTVKPNCVINVAENTYSVALLSDFQNALIGGNIIAVKKLIQDQVNFCNVSFDSGWTPLLYACYFVHIDMVNFLLENGADVNLSGSDGCTPLMSICKSTQKENVLEIINKLIQNGANPLAVDEHGKTALIFITRSGNYDATSLLLKYTAEIINHKDNKGFTALDWAISKTLESTIKLLIENGASVVNADPEDISLLSADIKNSLSSVSSICNGVNGLENSDATDVEEAVEINSRGEGSSIVEKDSIKKHSEIKKDNSKSILPAINHNEKEEVKDNTTKGKENSIENSCWAEPSTALQPDDDATININKGVMDDQYYKYGQLELLLCGLSLTHLIPKFHEHDFEFEQLLCATPDDLINIGVKQVGARNRILTAIKDWHTTEWKDTSLPNFSSTALTFGNLQALLRISSEHLLYVSSGLRYAKLQLKTYPQVLQPPASSHLESNPDEMVIAQVDDLVQATHKLCQSLKSLHLQVNTLNEAKSTKFKQADFIKTVPPISDYKSKLAVVSLPVLATCLFCIVRFKLIKL